MLIQKINGWWMSTDTLMGSTDTSSIGSRMIDNARKIRDYFKSKGWSDSAIAGMLGNIQLESTFSPALIQSTNRWRLPNSAANLSDVPNSVMLNFYDSYYGGSGGGYGIGIVQWDGYTPTSPAGQKLVSFAERYGLNWYDGDTQTFRIFREYETNIQWQSATINGITWYWSNYVTNTQTPEVSARIWQVCYEVADPGTLATRQANARYWYDYFIAHPTAFSDPVYLLLVNANKKKVVKNVRFRN